MFRLFCPDLHVRSVFDINLSQLWGQGIRGLIFDLDNTIIEWHNHQPSEDLLAFVQTAKNQGFKLCLVSNNRAHRVESIAEIIGVPCFSRAKKPSRRAFRETARLFALSPGAIAVIGDQLCTDVLGGNRLGMYTIWVTPLSSREFFGTRLTRLFEGCLVRLFRARGMLNMCEVEKHD